MAAPPCAACLRQAGTESLIESEIPYINEDAATTRKTLSICNHGNAKSGFPTFYDASYHALAILNNCNFITADRRHYQKTKALGHVRLLADMNIT